MNKIKAIFLDLDGTSCNNKKEISTNLCNIIKELGNKGIKVIITSGRSLTYTIDKSKLLNAYPIIIGGNGSIAYDYQNNKLILKKLIPQKIVKEIFEYSKTHNCILTAHEESNNYIIDKSSKITDEISSLTIQSTNYDRMQIINKLFEDKIPEVSITNSSRYLLDEKRVDNYTYFHDIASIGTSKGNALLEVLDYLNIDSKNTMCIGDSNNDISMFLVSEYPIAVSNATNKLKSYSKKIIKSNEEDGVYYFLKDLIDKKIDLN